MKIIKRFHHNNSGAFALIFSIILLPIVLAVGLATDFAKLKMHQSALQSGADAAALAATKYLWENSNIEPDKVKSFARSYFDGNFLSPIPIVNFQVTLEKGSVTVEPTGLMNTSFMRVLPGNEQVNIHVKSRAEYGIGPADLVLVLDTTGSMDLDSRMPQLKQAALDMVDRLAVTGSPVRISVVPFNTQVKLDADEYRQESWFRFEGLTRAEWEGCLNSRDRPYHIQMSIPDASIESKYYAEPCIGSSYGSGDDNEVLLSSILPLTTNYEDVREKIRSLTPSNNTNISIGLAWGLQLLMRNNPINQKLPQRSAQKILVLISDGENTESRVHSTFDASGTLLHYDEAAHREDTVHLCHQAKNLDIDLYTIRLVDGDEDLMRRCALGEGKYFDIDRAQDLKTIFRYIENTLTSLHLTD